jgi:hypothetical protein
MDAYRRPGGRKALFLSTLRPVTILGLTRDKRDTPAIANAGLPVQ